MSDPISPSSPAEEVCTPLERFFVFLLFLGSAFVAIFLVRQVWEHVALIVALLVVGVLSMVGFEMLKEGREELG